MNSSYNNSYASTSSLIKHQSLENGKLKNIEKASVCIRYFDPYERLIWRKQFEEVFKQKIIKKDDKFIFDSFSLFDAVAKRGGYHEVRLMNRWEEINSSLFYKNVINIPKYYLDFMLPYESDLLTYFPAYKDLANKFRGIELIEMHLLTSNCLTTNYYQLTVIENDFFQANFLSLDEYFNLKTLIFFDNDVSAIPIQYAEKYYLLKKWMYFYSQYQLKSANDFNNLHLKELNEDIHVGIVGLNVSTLLMAEKLSNFKVKVTLFDFRKETASNDQFVTENGILLLEGGKETGSYYQLLKENNLDLDEIPYQTILMIDEEGKPYSEERIIYTEQIFMSILEELKNQLNNRNNLYEEITNRLCRRKLEGQKMLIKWHYDRYLLWNKIKGDYTTVIDLISYQSKKGAKNIVQNYHLAILNNINKLITHLQKKSHVNIVKANIKTIEYKSGGWSVNLESQASNIMQFSHLIYAQSDTLYRCVTENNYKIPSMMGLFIGEGLNILQQLLPMRYVNCLYKFKDKVQLKEALKGVTAFSSNWTYGLVYYFVINNGHDIIATSKCYPNHRINYYSDLFAVLQNRFLCKATRMNGDEIFSYEYSFGLKDQKFIDKVIKVRDIERMFFMIPLTTTNCPHRLQALIDMNNHITGQILQTIYPDFKIHPQFKNMFNPNITQIINPIKTQTDKLQLLHHSIQPEKKKQPQDKKDQRLEFPKPPISSNHANKTNDFNFTPAGQLLKSLGINSTETSKLKIIGSGMSEDKKEIKKVSEGEIPILNSVYQLGDDYFGMKHPFVKNYELFLSNKIENSNKIYECWTGLNFHQISQSIMLYPTLLLYSIGQPYISQSPNLGLSLKKNIVKQRCAYPLHNFVSRREFFSLEDSFKTTVYYQTIVLIEQELFYVIIDEKRSNFIYFHSDLHKLLDKFNQTIFSLRTLQQSEFPTSKKIPGSSIIISRTKIGGNPPQHLLPYLIRNQIQKQLQKSHLNIDEILDSKLERSKGIQKNRRHMRSEDQIEAEDESTIFELFMKDKSECLYQEISSYLELNLRIYELKPFQIFDIFIGTLNEQYLACEIMQKESENALIMSQLEKMDYNLCEEVKQVFSKDIRNQENSLIIVPDQATIKFHRNFMNFNRNGEEFQRYTYIRDVQIETQNKKQQYLLLAKNLQETFPSKKSFIKFIIQKLLINYTTHQILLKFKNLINKELTNQINLLPRFKIYYRMTKKCFAENLTPNIISLAKDKCSNLLQKHKQILYQKLESKSIEFVENDFIYIIG